MSAEFRRQIHPSKEQLASMHWNEALKEMAPYEGWVKNILWNMVYNREDVDDLYQRVLMKLYSQIARGKPIHSFQSWIGRVARNVGIDFLKDPNVRRRLNVEDPKALQHILDTHYRRDTFPNPEQATLSKQWIEEHWEELQTALTMLSDEHAEVFKMRELEERSYKEIAEMLEIPLGTVMSRLHSARKNLKKALRRIHALS